MSIDNGGPAVPTDNERQVGAHSWHFEGMSLRDYFAAHAPQPRDPMGLEEHCAYRYRYADAMLASRTTQQEPIR